MIVITTITTITTNLKLTVINTIATMTNIIHTLECISIAQARVIMVLRSDLGQLFII
jgi:hypothetical protein